MNSYGSFDAMAAGRRIATDTSLSEQQRRKLITQQIKAGRSEFAQANRTVQKRYPKHKIEILSDIEELNKKK